MDVPELKKEHLKELLKTECQRLAKNEVFVNYLNKRIPTYDPKNEEQKFLKERDEADLKAAEKEIENNNLFITCITEELAKIKK